MPQFGLIHVVVDNSVDWTAIAGVAGTLLGTLLGAWFQDRRRYTQEAKLRSGDDLLEMIDEVAVKLEELADAAATMQQMVFAHGVSEEYTRPASRATNAAYQRARATIARMRMRPHADPVLLEKATEAANEFLAAWQAVHNALNSQASSAKPATAFELGAMEVFPRVDAGYAGQKAYEAAAQETILSVRGGPAKKQHRWTRRTSGQDSNS